MQRLSNGFQRQIITVEHESPDTQFIAMPLENDYIPPIV